MLSESSDSTNNKRKRHICFLDYLDLTKLSLQKQRKRKQWQEAHHT
jgi:hypothetical protein